MTGTDKGFTFRDEAEAQTACEWWQKELGLADWDIKVSIDRRDDMKTQDAPSGEYDAHASHKRARIRLLSPLDYSNDTRWPQDHERTLIHELLHCVWWFNPQTEYGSLQETLDHQAIQGLSTALVALRRRAYPSPPWLSIPADRQMADEIMRSEKQTR